MQFTKRSGPRPTRGSRLATTALLLVTALSLTTTSNGAHANEHGAPPAEGAEGGGEGAAPPKPPRDHKEYVEKTTKLGALASKLEESEHHFAELVHEKEHSPTADAKQPLLKEMAEVAKQRNVDVTAYNKLKSDLTLRYPNQGEHLNRHFRAHEAKSAEELEHGISAGPSLDDLLTETKQMILKKYPDPAAAAAPTGDVRHPASVPNSEAKPSGRLRLER